MADEQRPSWWKSLPGILTAATGFVAALSGLVAGLNQLGAFRQEQPAPQVVSAAPAPRESTPDKPAAPAADGGASSTARPTAPAAGRPVAPPAVTPPVSTPARLPKGTALELAVPGRTCAPASDAERFTARLVTPVKVGGTTVLPANTTAILHLRRAGSPAAPQVRLDSLVRQDMALAMPPSDVRLRRGATSGACLRANARITVTLGAAVTLRRR